MEKVKVICCDIDGTLVRDDKSLSEENIKWVRKAVHEAHVPFVLVSGRPESGVRPMYDKLGITGPVSCFNGGTLVDEDGSIADDHRLPHDIAVSLIDIRRRVGAVDQIIFDGMRWFLETRDCYCYPAKRAIYATEPEIGDLRLLLDRFDTNKVVFLSPDADILDMVEKEIGKSIDSGKITVYRSGDFIEVMGSDYDKGSAVTALARMYGIEEAEVMALGDDCNDVPMLKKAGFSVAMGNAVREAKEAAAYVTDTNNDDGVAKAIRRHVFEIK